MQKESGVKDHIAQHWIEQLLPRGRELTQRYLTNPATRDPRFNGRFSAEARKDLRAQYLERIHQEQWEWLVQQPPHRYAALPQDDGEFFRYALH